MPPANCTIGRERERMHGVESAKRRFPEVAARVARLAECDEAFRDMCEELAAAEDALEGNRGVGTAAAERREECEGWIVRLVAEIAEALGRSPDSVTGPGSW